MRRQTFAADYLRSGIELIDTLRITARNALGLPRRDNHLKAYPRISPLPVSGRGVGGEGGSNRCRFSRWTLTVGCPHPNPLPEGEGTLG